MRARQYNVDLSEKLTTFYASHAVSSWQKAEVDKIRKAYEAKEQELNIAHDMGMSRISDRFMQLELDWLMASDDFKQNNPGKEWHPSGVKGLLSKAFWTNLFKSAKEAGVNLTPSNGKEIVQN